MARINAKPATLVRPDTLLTSVAVLLVVNLVQRSIGFGRGILFCRWLDPEALGQWEMAYGFLILAAPVAVLGLPGSFGRYLERFRQRGQLQTFLVRTTLWTFGFAAATVSVLVIFRDWFAYLVFGDSGAQYLLVLVAAVLATVILHHFLEAVFAGLRVFRVVSAMQFAQSMLFATLSLTLLATWRTDAWSIVAGYGGACLLSALGVLAWSRRFHWQSADEAAAESHRTFWPPLLRFAVWVWVSNVLSNLFSIIDRYMLVHYTGLPSDESMQLVGYYHTSMLVPVLLVSVANLLVGAITPHFSHHWESGDRDGVSSRLILTLKLAALGTFAAGIGVLVATPLLFHLAFGGKYDQGLLVLPWALASCVWFGLLLISQTYVWCAEKTRHASIPLAIGLVSNVLLNMLLLPRLGLQGAVMATALSTLIALAAQLVVNTRLGMRNCWPGMIVVLAPFGLTQGLAIATASAGLLLVVVFGTPWVFSTDERNLFVELLRKRLLRWFPLGKRSLISEG